MDDRVSDDVARNRWMVINAVRASGVAMVMVAILILQGAIPLPALAGYVILGVGLIDIFVAPQLLARKWRSPRE
jgi:hypothetical protein